MTFEEVADEVKPKHNYSLKQYAFVPNNGKVPSDAAKARDLKAYADLCNGYLFSKASELVKKGVQSTTLSGIVNHNKDASKVAQFDQEAYKRFAKDPKAALLHLLEQTFEILGNEHSGSADDVFRKTVASLR